VGATAIEETSDAMMLMASEPLAVVTPIVAIPTKLAGRNARMLVSLQFEI
jgi:hypothetical protein